MQKNRKSLSEYHGQMPITKIPFRERFRGFLAKYNIKDMHSTVTDYGYNYSLKKFFLSGAVICACLVGVALYVKLDYQYAVLMAASGVLIFPLIVQAQFEQMYQLKRFDMITSYLDNVLPIFKKSPMIAHAWKECIDLLDGEMKICVEAAYDRVSGNTDDPDVFKSAFSIIESKFPNSRIHSVHQMMYSVTTKNTKNYGTSVDNMWYDVQAWITRTGIFRQELQRRKMDLIILSVLTAFMNCMFTVMYSSNEIFAGFTGNHIYQVSTYVFLQSLMVLMTVFQMKLHGKWLLDDATISVNKKAVKAFTKIIIDGMTPQVRPADIVMAVLILGLCGVGYYFTKNATMLLVGAFAAYMCYTSNKRSYNLHIKNLKNFLAIEFPTWLRDITINLYNLTVINAISESRDTASVIFTYYLDGFLDEFQSNPAGIKPYNDFLSEFRIDGVRPAMKVLYSLQSLSADDVISQTSDLIIRNQEMLSKAERMKNDSALGGLKLLGFIPVALLVMQMLINMALMFITMLELMSGAMTIPM